MKGKKLAAKIMLGLLLATPYTAWANDQILSSFSTTEDINIDASNGKYVLNFKDNQGNITDKANFAVLAPGSSTIELKGNNNIFNIYAKAGNVGLGIEAQAGSNVVIGNENSSTVMNLTSDQWIMGIRAAGADKDTQGATVTINGKSFVLNAECTNPDADGTVYGLYVQNFTTEAEEGKRAKLVVNAENTIINVKAATEGGASGLVAMSQGILDVNSNLEVNADNAIVVRGDAKVTINESGEKTTKLNGDINFNYDEATSGTKVDADVLVNLTGADSYWNGNAVVSWGSGAISDEEKAEVSGLDLIVADGAEWNPTYVEESAGETTGTTAIAINNLTANDGVIKLDNMKDQEVRIENLTGESLNVNVVSAENKLAITKSNSVESLTVAANGAYAEELVKQDIVDSLTQLGGQVVDSFAGDKTAATSAVIAETGVVGTTIGQFNENGDLITDSVRELTNQTTAGIGELANVAFMAWRAENDEMHQRMGELRSSKGEAGIWARMKRGESESGDLNIKNQYSTYQLGYDEKVGDSNWYLGGAISRTEGKSSFATGSGENQSTGFTVYGTYVGDDGQYVDLSAKYARLDNEFDVFGRDSIESTGDYRNNGYAFSAEYGKRIEAGNDFWVEPQVQLTYGHLSSANYTTSRGIKAAQDAMDSIVGRVGFAAGKDIGAGNVYVKASYLYDFDGDTSVTMNDGVNSRTYEQDLGGGWFEFGIGTNINLSETSHLYFDVERAVGGDIDTPWQWNAGVRFDF